MRFINKSALVAAALAALCFNAAVYAEISILGELNQAIDPLGYGIPGQPANTTVDDLLIGITDQGGIIVNDNFNPGPLINLGDSTLGQFPGSYGAVIFDGFPMDWLMDGDLIIGQHGKGKIDVFDSGKVQVGDATYVFTNNPRSVPAYAVVAGDGTTTLGQEESGFGELHLTNVASRLVTSDLIVGDLGDGLITALSTSSLITGDAYIGNADGSSGTVTISDPGTRWTVGTPPVTSPPTPPPGVPAYTDTPGTLVIGNAPGSSTVGIGGPQTGLGQGYVTIANQGLVEISDSLIINRFGYLELQTQGRLRILPSSGTTDAIINGGEILGNGFIDFVDHNLVNDGVIVNDGNAAQTTIEGTTNGTQPEKIIFTAGPSDLLTNNSIIRSEGGQMDFLVPVTNSVGATIIARDANMNFYDGLTNDGTLVVGGDSTILGTITPLPLANVTILNDSIVTIVGDLLFTEPFLLTDGEGEVAASIDNSATLSIAIGESPGYLTVTGNLDLTNAELDLDIAGMSAPDLGDIVNLITVQGDVTGTFVNDSVVVGGQRWDVDYAGGSIFATYAGLASVAGDFDGDGDVDGRDFMLWQRGGSPTPGSATDLADWQSNYGSTGSLGAELASVPEPSSLLLSVLALAGMTARKR